MKSLILLLSTLLTCHWAQAGSATITSDESVFHDVAAVPQQVLSLLLQNNADVQEKGDGVYAVEMNNINCSSHSNAPLDTSDYQSGIPSEVCRYNSNEDQDSQQGTLLSDGRLLEENALKVENSEWGMNLYFQDCAMGGKCVTYIKNIHCDIDTKIETYSAGRFSCTFTDGL